MKEKIILIGGGGHCRACIDVIEQEGKYDIVGILDTSKRVGKKIMNYEIIGIDQDIPKFKNNVSNFFITIGQIKSPQKRIILYETIKKVSGKLPVIVSPLAYVANSAKIGEGTIVMHHSLVNASAYIGKNCIINSKALIEHDAMIGDHCHISTASVINGDVKVGEKTFFGSGAISLHGARVPPNSFIKANTLFLSKPIED